MKYLLLIVFASLNAAFCLGLLDEDQLRAEAIFIGGVTSRDIQQTLIPDIQFTCAGALTKWTIVASPVGGGLNYPELQIWRRTGNGNDFTKVGQTKFSKSSTSTINRVYEHIPDSPLNFEAGDVLGVHTPPAPKLSFKFQKQGGPRNYYIGGPLNPCRSFSLNGAGVISSRNDYPLVSVEVNRTDCISRFIDRATLELKASLLTVNNSDLEYKEATQRVIPELAFSESGQIDSFTIGALRVSGSKYPELQLWRAAGDREWVKPASSPITPAVSFTEHLNVHQYQFFPPLQVQAGDVLGIYQPYNSASALKLYYQDDGPLNYYKPVLGSSANRIVENAVGVYSRRNRPLINMIFRPDPPPTPPPINPTTTASAQSSLPVPSSMSSASDHTSQYHTSQKPTATKPAPQPTSKPVPVIPGDKKTLIILLVCIMVLILTLVVVVLLVIMKLISSRIRRENSVERTDNTDTKSLEYNATYFPRNPTEIITNGKKQVVDLAINTAYKAPPKLDSAEHVYDTID